MKKTVKHPDGREETIEGTSEEIAEYERKLKQESPKSKKKDILKGKSVFDCPCTPCTEVRASFLKTPQIVPFIFEPIPYPHYPTIPYNPPVWTKPDHGGLCACPQCCPTTWTITNSDVSLGVIGTIRNTSDSTIKVRS